jgi:hypothetical protein
MGHWGGSMEAYHLQEPIAGVCLEGCKEGPLDK